MGPVSTISPLFHYICGIIGAILAILGAKHPILVVISPHIGSYLPRTRAILLHNGGVRGRIPLILVESRPNYKECLIKRVFFLFQKKYRIDPLF